MVNVGSEIQLLSIKHGGGVYWRAHAGAYYFGLEHTYRVAGWYTLPAAKFTLPYEELWRRLRDWAESRNLIFAACGDDCYLIEPNRRLTADDVFEVLDGLHR